MHVARLSFPLLVCVVAVQVLCVPLLFSISQYHALNKSFYCIHCARCVPLYSEII